MPNGTVINISTGTGLAGGPITSTGTVSLETLSPSPAGTYTNAAVQVDSIGRVISASNGSVASGTMSFYPSASFSPELILIIPGQGTNNSTNITNTGYISSTITVGGDAKFSTEVNDPYGVNSGVIKFDGTGDYLFIDNSNYAAATSDFTYDMWIYPLTYGGTSYSIMKGTIIDIRTGGGYGLLITTSTTNGGLVFWDSETRYHLTGGNIPLSAWTHLAVVRSSNNIKVFLNGSLSGSFTYNGLFTSQRITFGTPEDSRSNTDYLKFNGYMSDIRFSKTARYTTNFSLPATRPAGVYDTSTLPATASLGQIVAARSNLFICTNATGPTWKSAILTSL